MCFFSSSRRVKFLECFFSMFEFLVNKMNEKYLCVFNLYLYASLHYLSKNVHKKDIEKDVNCQYFESFEDMTTYIIKMDIIYIG